MLIASLIVSHDAIILARVSGAAFARLRQFKNSTAGSGHIVRTLTRFLMRLRNCSEKPRRPRLCNCAIIAIRACTSMLVPCFTFTRKIYRPRVNLLPSFPLLANSRASSLRAWRLRDRLTVLFGACRIMEMRICERVWRSTEIMALTVVPSTRVFNGNGESLLIKVHATIIGDRWPRSRRERWSARSRRFIVAFLEQRHDHWSKKGKPGWQ